MHPSDKVAAALMICSGREHFQKLLINDSLYNHVPMAICNQQRKTFTGKILEFHNLYFNRLSCLSQSWYSSLGIS